LVEKERRNHPSEKKKRRLVPLLWKLREKGKEKIRVRTLSSFLRKRRKKKEGKTLFTRVTNGSRDLREKG